MDADGDLDIVSINTDGEFVYYNNTMFVGLENIEDQTDLKIVPNPAKNSVSISSEHEIVSYEILGISGQPILHKSLSEKSLQISLLPPGIYFLKVELQNNEHVVRKLVVTK